MADLADRLGYEFADPDLLHRALTHKSLESEDEWEQSNERLEFLGDAVLGLVIAEVLHERWDLDEGAMAKVRAAVVDYQGLADVARSIGLGEQIRLGRGEEASGGHDKDSILADAMEAVIGAVFLDGGLEPARRLILSHWLPMVEERVEDPGARDYKTRLQEALATGGVVPEYRVTGSGPDHARTFDAVVTADGRELGSGSGTSKKRAEQAAAQAALARLDA